MKLRPFSLNIWHVSIVSGCIAQWQECFHLINGNKLVLKFPRDMSPWFKYKNTPIYKITDKAVLTWERCFQWSRQAAPLWFGHGSAGVYCRSVQGTPHVSPKESRSLHHQRDRLCQTTESSSLCIRGETQLGCEIEIFTTWKKQDNTLKNKYNGSFITNNVFPKEEVSWIHWTTRAFHQ